MRLFLIDFKRSHLYCLTEIKAKIQGGIVRKRLFVSALLTIFISFPGVALAQSQADQMPAISLFTRQPTMLIDCPTAGTLERGHFNAIMRSYPRGGILTATNIGLSNRLQVGISYGAEGIIAEESPNWNPRIEFNVKLSLIDEGLVFPAATLGFCSQGYGSWHTDIDRYTYKSKGFFAVASKNYPFYDWEMGLHGGVNYSTEQEDDDDNIDFFIGLDTRFNRDVGLVIEYDFALNDNKDLDNFGKGRGYLNLGLQWIYEENLVLEVLLKNLNSNRDGVVDIWRGLRVTYVEAF